MVTNKSVANKELDFVKAMNAIAKVEKSKQGDYKFLKNELSELGEDTFEKMATLGFIQFGFYILDGKIVDTYAVTQNYKEWYRILKRREMLKKFFPWVSV